MRRSIAVLAALLLVLATPPAGTAAAAPHAVTDDTRAWSHATLSATATPGASEETIGRLQPNNSTRHVDPDTVNEEGDIGEVSVWLERRLLGRLEENQVRISNDFAENADGLFDEAFERRLGQYVEVAGETDRSEPTEEIQRAQDAQEDLAEQTSTFRELRSEYQAARREGNVARARETARRLQRTAAEIDRTTSRLDAIYSRLSNRTGIDFSRAIEALETVERDTERDVSEINQELFVGTRLTVSTDSETASFLDPIRLEGTLRTTNGTPVGPRTIELQVGSRTVTVETDDTGSFSTAIRPATLRTGEQTVRAEYVPATTGRYLGSNATVSVTVQQTEGTISVDSVPDGWRFGERVVIAGTVAADDVGAAGVPVVVSIAGVQVASGRTDGDGRFTLDARLPAEIEPGDRAVEIAVPLSERALSVPTESQSVAVETTATQLTVNLSSDGRTIETIGRLTTPDERPVPNQRIALLVDGDPVTSTTTGDDGRFTTTFRYEDAIENNGSVTVTAVYRGTGTNLERTEATAVTTLSVQPSDPDGSDGDEVSVVQFQLPGVGTVNIASDPDGSDDDEVGVVRFQLSGTGTVSIEIPLLIGGVVALLIGGGGLLYVRTGGRTTPDSASDTESPGADVTAGAVREGSTRVPMTERARDSLESENLTEAVRIAYAAGRTSMTERHDLDGSGTHWEFFRRCKATSINEGERDSLKQLTEIYERAAFAPSEVTESTATEALDLAERLDPE